MSKVERYRVFQPDLDGRLPELDPDGDLVYYIDHLAALAAKQLIIDSLAECLNGSSKATYTAEVHDRLLAEAVAAERERCAKIAENSDAMASCSYVAYTHGWNDARIEIAAAIRASGKEKAK